MATAKPAATVVRAIVELAHNLSLTVCAEGVETSPAFEFLEQIGCDALQGDFIAPVDARRRDRNVHRRVEWSGSHAGAGRAEVAHDGLLG